MKKYIFISLIAVVLLSGCLDQNTNQKVVKVGDNISVDYIGSFLDGEVFDTSIEKVAKENGIYNPNREYKPLEFRVGSHRVIKGLEDGVIGMKLGESKTLTIPPKDAYGEANPELIKVRPQIEVIPLNETFSRVETIPINTFRNYFGLNHSIGDDVSINGTELNLKIINLTSKDATLSFNLKKGDEYNFGAPWNQTVVYIDEKNVSVRNDVKLNETYQFPNFPWNTTVIGINSTNITLKHNPIPDTEIPSFFGSIRVHFNDTSIILDKNNKLAGKTLVFNVTIKSIEK